MLKYLDPKKSEKVYRVSHSIYHHDLAPNISTKGIWGDETYSVCTNHFGFKISCNKLNSNKLDTNKLKNIAFIGDSFTEGVGLEYEDTFVGIIDSKLRNFNIYNMGVSSYSTSIYLTKVKYWIENGLTFDEVVVYIDISDVQDEAISYRILDGKVMNRVKENLTLKELVSNQIQWAFPLSHKSVYEFKRLLVNGERVSSANSEINIYPNRSAWTYDKQVSEYGVVGIEGGIDINLKNMDDLYQYLKKKNIPLSIGIYPWPAQIKYDLKNSQQVLIWKQFCENKCKNFYDNFHDFELMLKQNSSDELIDKFYINNDIHFNKNGNKVIAENFLKNYK